MSLCCPHCAAPIEKMTLDATICVTFAITPEGIPLCANAFGDDLIERALGDAAEQRLFCTHCGNYLKFDINNQHVICGIW